MRTSKKLNGLDALLTVTTPKVTRKNGTKKKNDDQLVLEFEIAPGKKFIKIDKILSQKILKTADEENLDAKNLIQSALKEYLSKSESMKKGTTKARKTR